MFYAHFSDVVEMKNFVFFCELAAFFALFRAFYVFIRCKMVEDYRDFFFIENAINAVFFHFVYGDGSGDVVSEDHVEINENELARGNRVLTGRFHKQFFR